MHMFMDTINWDSLSDGFTKTNVNQTGFSCVNYDIYWSLDDTNQIIPPVIIEGVERRRFFVLFYFQILSAVDRAGLLEDAFYLSR